VAEATAEVVAVATRWSVSLADADADADAADAAPPASEHAMTTHARRTDADAGGRAVHDPATSFEGENPRTGTHSDR
jgi:hypothetical protein